MRLLSIKERYDKMDQASDPSMSLVSTDCAQFASSWHGHIVITIVIASTCTAVTTVRKKLEWL